MKSFEVSSMVVKNDTTTSRFSNNLEFWISCLGYAVGYGNIWRFPYMLFQNGGGVFFIPYFFCIIVIVLPLSYLEISYGQIYRRALHRYYDKIHPRFLGLSFGISVIIF
jgi:SNF family Na+-dependent transporter